MIMCACDLKFLNLNYLHKLDFTAYMKALAFVRKKYLIYV